MILSHAQLEEIAAATTRDFNKFFFREISDKKHFVQATPIDQLATNYLGLDVSFAHLSDDGSLCGLTAYADTEYTIQEAGRMRTIPLRQNQVLLDDSFIRPGQVKQQCGKRRFTLAHGEACYLSLFPRKEDNPSRFDREGYSGLLSERA